MSQGAKRRSRGLAIVLVGVLHVLIIERFILVSQTQQPPIEDDADVPTLFFFDTTEQPRLGMTVNRGKPSPGPHRESGNRATDSALPITAMPAAPESTAPVTVDWAKEAERTAADRIEDDEQVRSRAPTLLPNLGLNVGMEAAAPPTVKFGWDYAHTHRFEALSDGGSILSLNDRCAIVIKFPLILGGCKIGKIESRGDLFTHMDEAH